MRYIRMICRHMLLIVNATHKMLGETCNINIICNIFSSGARTRCTASFGRSPNPLNSYHTHHHQQKTKTLTFESKSNPSGHASEFFSSKGPNFFRQLEFEIQSLVQISTAEMVYSILLSYVLCTEKNESHFGTLIKLEVASSLYIVKY